MNSTRTSQASSVFKVYLIPLCFVYFFSLISLASSPSKSQHQPESHGHSKGPSMKSHQHGMAVLNIAFEGSKGVLELNAPNESIVGFEHKARTASEKMKIQKTEKIFQNQAQDIFVFDGSLKCQMTPKNVNLQSSGHAGHTETQASYEISCQKSPEGSSFRMQWENFFPSLRQVQVQILLDDLQKSDTLSPSNNKVDLK